MFPKKEDSLSLFIEALVAGSSDGLIERQEARGQQALINSETLPHKFNGCTQEQFEAMGIVFGEKADELFSYVTLPTGWKKRPTDHSMWSKLVDERGRERASIFYKAAFYDRDAFMDISRRFSYSHLPVLGYDHPDYRKGNWVGVVTDCNNVIYRTAEIEPEPGFKTNRDAWLAWDKKRETMVQEAQRWLEYNYPDWKNPLAYWD